MEWAFAWQNIIFLIPLVFGVLMVLAQALGLHGDGDTDADHDVAHDAHVGHEHDGSSSEQHHDTHHEGFAAKALGLLGVGRVPMSTILASLGLLFGGVGIGINRMLESILPVPIVYGMISVAVASVAAFMGTGFMARLIARVLPKTETYSLRKEGLVGRTGELLFGIKPGQEGVLLVRDPSGSPHQVTARLERADQFLPKEAKVLITGYEPEGNWYHVVPESALFEGRSGGATS
ncbi:DUF1449 family protein [Candidatus Uhrbacteria bacterium]|nr:DUF1449 family protein [Candidatus Uhrbacteria bacterium]